MELKLILESLLFSAQKPLSTADLCTLLSAAADQEGSSEETRALRKTSEADATMALEQLAHEHETARRSYRLVCVAGAWQFVTQPEFAPWLKALVGLKARPPHLSQPALETLAIIAYRQPITRADIEQIRGVNVDGVMQTLGERGLITQVGRAEAVGRPPTYGTTPLFLEYFGLRSLADLPAADELRRVGIQKPSMPAAAGAGLATPPPGTLKEEARTQNVETAPTKASASTAIPDQAGDDCGATT
jgi:segregation and condensation protein B